MTEVCVEPQLWVGDERPCRDLIESVKNGYPKPVGGLWTSTVLPGEVSAWVGFCEENGLGFCEGGEKFRLVPRSDVDVLVIDSVGDARGMVERFGVYVRGLGVVEELGRLERWRWTVSVPNFEAVQEEYDAVRVTDDALTGIRYSVGRDVGLLGLYLWDCESTYWFDWCFREVEFLGEVGEV